MTGGVKVIGRLTSTLVLNLVNTSFALLLQKAKLPPPGEGLLVTKRVLEPRAPVVVPSSKRYNRLESVFVP